MHEELIVPVAPRRFLASDRFERLKDFQVGWYFKLWLHMAINGGGLPLDRNIWRLAGAHTEQFWTQNAAAVLACFEIRDVMGKKEIYSVTLEHSLEFTRKLVEVQHLSSLTKTEQRHIKKVCKSFTKPSLEEVKNYCQERQSCIDPDTFWHFYESKGWRVGNQPMKSWHSSIATWERNPRNGGNGQAPSAVSERTRKIINDTAGAMGVTPDRMAASYQDYQPFRAAVVGSKTKRLSAGTGRTGDGKPDSDGNE